MNPIRWFPLFAMTLTVVAQAAPADEALRAARERLRRALTTTAGLPSCTFAASWGPAAPAGKDEKDEDEDEDAQAAAVRKLAMAAGGNGAGKADGSWTPGLMHCRTGDDELVFADRRSLAKSGDREWTLRKGRFADGSSIQFLPDPQLLLQLLQGFDLAVTHREVGTLRDRPVEIVGATLNQDQVADLMWNGQLPEGATAFGGAMFVAVGGALAGRPAPAKPDATVDLAFFLDPASGEIHRIVARMWTKNEFIVGGGRVIRMRAGGAGVVVGGADEADDEDEAKAKEGPQAATPALVYRDGLPERPRQKRLVTDFDVAFSQHGTAKGPELDAKAQALLRKP